MTHKPDWYLDGMKQDGQSITRDWQLLNQKLIDGVAVKQVNNVPTGYGHLCEVYRADWQLDGGGVDQVFFSVLEPGGISGWHVHGKTIDRLFVAQGQMLIVLYDARQSSSTHGQVNQFRLGTVRPALVLVPPGVWHAVQNIGPAASLLINVVDHAYQYEQPDHYRLPLDSEEIPYRFSSGREG
jgi:dTDP-4-dehydrorhamnose 3,5-epimerase